MSRSRPISLISLLSRLGWQKDPALWTVPCRDQRGKKALLWLEIRPSGVAIRASTSEPVVLPPLMVGRLRAALRDAAVAQIVLSSDQQSSTKEVDHDFNDAGCPRDRADSDAA